MTPLATALSFGDGKENAFPSAFAGNTGDRWAAAYTANLVVPESGLYSFYSLSDDQLIFMIDDYKVLSVNGAGVASYGGCYLEKGIHTLYLGLLEITSDAYVTLYVKQPSESDYKLVPGDWLVPDVGAATLAGRGTVAADAGTVTSAGAGVDTGFNSGFAGSFAAANGGLVQKTGGGIMTAERVARLGRRFRAHHRRHDPQPLRRRQGRVRQPRVHGSAHHWRRGQRLLHEQDVHPPRELPAGKPGPGDQRRDRQQHGLLGLGRDAAGHCVG